MFRHHSLITRIAIGKMIGLVLGLIGFFLIPLLAPDTSLMFRWGVMFWYITLGAIIGVFGVLTWHPVLRLPMPWWFRSSVLGAWMNFVLILFTYESFRQLSVSVFGETSLFVSPFWFVLEGAIVGLLMGYVATRFGGEGKDIIDVP